MTVTQHPTLLNALVVEFTPGEAGALTHVATSLGKTSAEFIFNALSGVAANVAVQYRQTAYEQLLTAAKDATRAKLLQALAVLEGV